MFSAGTQSQTLITESLLPTQTLSSPRTCTFSCQPTRCLLLNRPRAPQKAHQGPAELVLLNLVLFESPRMPPPSVHSPKPEIYFIYSRFFLLPSWPHTKPLYQSPLEFTYPTVTPSVSSSLFYSYLHQIGPRVSGWSLCSPAHAHTIPKPPACWIQLLIDSLHTELFSGPISTYSIESLHDPAPSVLQAHLPLLFPSLL